MGFRLFKLIVCLLLAGPLASPRWGHTRVESPARVGAHVLTEWQGGMAEDRASESFDLKARYTYDRDLVKQDRVTSPAASDASNHYGYDGLGSVQAWAFGETYVYDALGILLNIPSTTPSDYGYTVEQWDPDLGLYYPRARYCNPADGRFLTVDTFEGNNSDPLSLHKYLYANGNPVNRTNPSGHDSLIGVSVASAIGGSLHAMYDGGVSAAGSAMQATLFGAQAGKSMNEVLTGFVLDETGLSLAVDAYQGIKDYFGSDQDSGEIAEMTEMVEHFNYAVLPLIVEDGDYIPTGIDQQDPQCFAAGTLVMTEPGLRPIELVREGDRVWALDLATQERCLKPVLKTFQHLRSDWRRVTIDEVSIEVTGEHPFFVKEKGWVRAENLSAGDRLVTFHPQDEAVVRGVEAASGPIQVFNFEVEDLHDYFISDEGVLVHNRSWKKAFHHFNTVALGSKIPYRDKILRAVARPMDAWKHMKVHRRLDEHLSAIKHSTIGGLTMLPSSKNPGKVVRKEFSRRDRLNAISRFYREYNGGEYWHILQGRVA